MNTVRTLFSKIRALFFKFRENAGETSPPPPSSYAPVINYIIGSSQSQLCKNNSCSVKLQGGPLDHNPRKIHVEDSWIIILRNNSKCLLLNDKQVSHDILFNLLEEIQNTKKRNTSESKERKFEKKVREIGWVILIFMYLYLYLLFSLAS